MRKSLSLLLVVPVVAGCLVSAPEAHAQWHRGGYGWHRGGYRGGGGGGAFVGGLLGGALAGAAVGTLIGRPAPVYAAPPPRVVYAPPPPPVYVAPPPRVVYGPPAVAYPVYPGY